MRETTRPTKVELAWMADKLIYLATPFTNYWLGYKQAANTAANIAARLCQATHGPVFSPIAHSYLLVESAGLDPVKDDVCWQPLNDYMLHECDILVIAHMDGWQESAGIAQEVDYFLRAGKPIFDLVDIHHLKMDRRWPQRPARERIDGRPDEAVDQEKREFLGHSPR